MRLADGPLGSCVSQPVQRHHPHLGYAPVDLGAPETRCGATINRLSDIGPKCTLPRFSENTTLLGDTTDERVLATRGKIAW